MACSFNFFPGPRHRSVFANLVIGPAAVAKSVQLLSRLLPEVGRWWPPSRCAVESLQAGEEPEDLLRPLGGRLVSRTSVTVIITGKGSAAPGFNLGGACGVP